MRSIKDTILEYLRLLRLQTGAATASAPLVGGLIMGQRYINSLVVLFILGIFYHIFGFVLNEYMDIEIDKKSSDLKDKPLVSGTINKNKVLLIVILCTLCSYSLIIFFHNSIYTISFFTISLIFGGLYDFYGKKIIGLDFALAGGFFFLCLTGASTISTDFNVLVYLVCLIYFFQIVFNNAVEGGIKDAEHDLIGGAKTLATFMGVNVIQGKIKMKKSFVVFSFSLRIIFLLLLIFIGLQPKIMLWSDEHILEIIILLLLIIILFTTLFGFLKSIRFDRSRLKKLFSIHEMTSFFIFIIVLSPLLDIWITIFLLLIPGLWYLTFNVILYGKLLEPRV